MGKAKRPLSDQQKILLLKHIIRDLRDVLEECHIDSSACLLGEPLEGPYTPQEQAWILKEYRANRL